MKALLPERFSGVPSPQAAHPSGGPRWFESRTARTLVAGLVVLALEGIVLRGHLTGDTMPPWDFVGAYNTDAYYWWAHGSFFDPVEWIPSMWGGYPAAASLQNSAWYLPVGLFSLFGPFTLEASAALAALHVAMAFAGAYCLVHRLTGAFAPALLAGTAWFFGAGQFSNAQHVDVARGYAWIPWVLLVMCPLWNWRDWRRVLLGVFLLWQCVAGVYPGMLVALGYVGVVWVLGWQAAVRPPVRRYLLPLGVAGLLAVLLCAPRLLTYFSLGLSNQAPVPDTSSLTLSMFGTLAFGYLAPELPNDLSMRSFFLPVSVLVLAFFAPWRRPATKVLVGGLGAAAVLGLPGFPWSGLVSNLPGMSLSRFTMSDFKPFLLLFVVILASLGLDHLCRNTVGLRALRWAGALSIAVGLVLSAAYGPYAADDAVTQLALLGAAMLSTWALLHYRWRVPVAILIAVTATSGVVWALGTTVPWSTPRLATEGAMFGMSVDDMLVTARERDTDLRQRPARMGLPEGYTEAEIAAPGWNRVSYSGELSVGGYVNLKGLSTQARLQRALLAPERGTAVAAFLAAPGGAATSGGTAVGARRLSSCATKGRCGPARVAPDGYEPGRFRYRVDTPVPVTALFNEAFYPGWRGSACENESSCRAVDVRGARSGLLRAQLPAGQYVFEFEYVTPRLAQGWLVFWIGAVTSIGWALGAQLVRQRSLRRDRSEVQ